MIPLSDVERSIKVLPNFAVDTSSEPYLGSQHQLYLVPDSPILANLEVRRAPAALLDLNALNKLVWFGYG